MAAANEARGVLLEAAAERRGFTCWKSIWGRILSDEELIRGLRKTVPVGLVHSCLLRRGFASDRRGAVAQQNH
jgi:hypothetical protein